MDLQDIYRSHPKLLIATLLAFIAVIVLVIILTIGSGGSSPRGPSGQVPTQRPTSRTPAASTVTVPNPNYHPSYAKHLPTSSVDQRYASEVDSSGPAIAAVEAVMPAEPGWTRAFPRVPAAATASDQAYVVAFLRELLSRDYGKQSRTDLQRWVSAEAGAELLPGEPRAAAVRALYGELFAPQAVGNKSDPVPSPAAWQRDARRGVVQRVSAVAVAPDPGWSRAVSEGLTTVDPLLRIDDASGTLTVITDGRTRRYHFSAQVLVASALHHPGYGVATIDAWEVR